MSENVVEIDNLTRRFGRQLALDQLSLRIPRGQVLGLVGENGAGKTTLIKHVLGLLRSQSGTVRVFGVDPASHPVAVLGRIGYLSEERDLPDWMRVGELMRYTQAFFPSWDQQFAEQLLAVFQLDQKQKVKRLSRGQRARTGLLVALAHRPDLLILDEPSSGLDPIVRRDILGAIIRTVADEGRTVLFSSHLLSEVQRVADSVAMIHAGRMVLHDTLDNVSRSHRKIVLHFAQPQSQAPALPGALGWSGASHDWTVLCDGGAEQLKRAAARVGARVIEEATPTLEEIFVARAGPSSGPTRSDTTCKP